jgi:hypothetical protein
MEVAQHLPEALFHDSTRHRDWPLGVSDRRTTAAEIGLPIVVFRFSTLHPFFPSVDCPDRWLITYGIQAPRIKVLGYPFDGGRSNEFNVQPLGARWLFELPRDSS